MSKTDVYKLERFTDAQELIYSNVVAELSTGKKQSHWMWFIFPQIQGLGFSSISKYYALASLSEALAYLRHPVLGVRLLECVSLVMDSKHLSASCIFGHPDDLKFHSSLTLFSRLGSHAAIFNGALKAFYQGKADARTISIISTLSTQSN